MKKLVDFAINVGKLKGKKRKGWTMINKIKDSETTAEHIFRATILAWILGKGKNLNMEKVIKMALVHDLCEVFSKDQTPYDNLISKNMKWREVREVLKRGSRNQYAPGQREKMLHKKFENEMKGLNRLLSELPSAIKSEMKNLWLEYEKGMTSEGRFVKQIDKVENLFQALEYWKKYGKIQRDSWIIAAREWCIDPFLVEFLNALDKKFPNSKKVHQS